MDCIPITINKQVENLIIRRLLTKQQLLLKIKLNKRCAITLWVKYEALLKGIKQEAK